MPKIQEYQQRADVQGPSRNIQATPNDFGANVGRSVAEFGNAVSRATDTLYQVAAKKEIINASLKLSQLQQTQYQNLENRLKNPEQVSDAKFFDKFLENYDTEASKIEESLSTPDGQRFFLEHNSQQRLSLAGSAMKGIAAYTAKEMQNELDLTAEADTSILLTDPNQFAILLKKRKESLEQMSTGLQISPGQLAEQQLKDFKNYATAAVLGKIRIDPQAVIKELDSGDWDGYFGADQKDMLIRRANSTIRANEADIRLSINQAKKAEAARIKAVEEDLFLKLHTDSLTNKDINNASIPESTKAHFYKALNTKITKTDPTTFNSLFERIHLPDGDPRKLTDSNELNKYISSIGITGITKLRREMNDAGTPEGKKIAALKMQLTQFARVKLVKGDPFSMIKDPEGLKNLAAFTNFWMDKYEERKKAGISPEDLLTPGNPEYLGRYIDNYQRTQQQIMQDQVNQFRVRPKTTTAPATPTTSNLPPKLPGESLQDYQKRTGAQ